jgi:hypothetical protein
VGDEYDETFIHLLLMVLAKILAIVQNTKVFLTAAVAPVRWVRGISGNGLELSKAEIKTALLGRQGRA